MKAIWSYDKTDNASIEVNSSGMFVCREYSIQEDTLQKAIQKLNERRTKSSRAKTPCLVVNYDGQTTEGMRGEPCDVAGNVFTVVINGVNLKVDSSRIFSDTPENRRLAGQISSKAKTVQDLGLKIAELREQMATFSKQGGK